MPVNAHSAMSSYLHLLVCQDCATCRLLSCPSFRSQFVQFIMKVYTHSVPLIKSYYLFKARSVASLIGIGGLVDRGVGSA